MRTPKDTVTRMKSDYIQEYEAQERKEKRRRKAILKRLVVFSTLAVLVLGSLTIYHFKQRSIQADIENEYTELQEEMIQLEKEEKDLMEEIALLKDEEYILELARTNYFLSKEGELIFLTDDSNN
ncbi:MAG TPA: septum formation initiator family protein [Pseudogracilibacillus sp.]|nr:septum formation initiator family protein [Pseudogracilibacillus sp.]